MFKYSQLDYDKFYSSEQCQLENKAILEILDGYCARGDTVVDLGAGTGLASALMGCKCHVIQVEADADMLRQNHYLNFVNCDALQYLGNRETKSVDVVTSIFALNYMSLGTITEAARVARKACVFVLYNKPYLDGSASFYAGKKWLYLLKHWLKSRLINARLNRLKLHGFSTWSFPLLGQSYYTVVVVRRA